MTEEISTDVESGVGSDVAQDIPEKDVAQDTDSTKVQDQDTTGESTDDNSGEQETQEDLTKREKRKADRAYKAQLREKRAEAEKLAQVVQTRHDRIVKAGESSTAPVEAEFDDYTEFVAAKAVWANSRDRDNRETELSTAEVEEARLKVEAIDADEKRYIQQNFQAQMVDAKARYADFDQVTSQPDVLNSKAVVEIIMGSDVGADVAYQIASDKALDAELSVMTPIEAARAIGRIEAGLQSPRSRTTSNAPTPINPVKGQATATKDPAKMSMSEYKKWRATG